MTDLTSLPVDLRVPVDDGAAAHLPGAQIPHVELRATDAHAVGLDSLGPGRTMLWVYPLSGQPGVALPDGWDTVPGARGCTPEACGFATTTTTSPPPPASTGCRARTATTNRSSPAGCTCRSSCCPTPPWRWPRPSRCPPSRRVADPVQAADPGHPRQHRGARVRPDLPPGEYAEQVLAWLRHSADPDHQAARSIARQPEALSPGALSAGPEPPRRSWSRTAQTTPTEGPRAEGRQVPVIRGGHR